MKKSFFSIWICLFLWSCGNDEGSEIKIKDVKIKDTKVVDTKVIDESEDLFILAIKHFKGPIKNEYVKTLSNKYSKEKVALGKKLFLDARLSKDNSISCRSCHPLDRFGVNNMAVSAGVNNVKGTRNAPTVFNAALHTMQFWDGRANTVEQQAGMPILNPIEMAMPSEKAVEEKLKLIAEYQKDFVTVFPIENEPITFKNIELAIGAFERTLIRTSKFDDYLGGDKKSLSDQETKGLKLFIQHKCTNCHSGPLLGGNNFESFGSTLDPYWNYTESDHFDYGLYEVTKKESDKFVFKTASLRDVDETYPYFHDGSVRSLEKSIKIMAKTTLDTEISDDEAKSIEVFLKTLTSRNTENN